MTDIENQRDAEKETQNANRTYKDSVFCDYLAEPARLIEVYNAAFGTNYPPDTAVEITKLDDVLYMERINDLSFVMDNKFVVLLEQQSTINQNMAIRMLLYVARLYEKLLNNENLYKRNRIQVFTPVFIVFYNGSVEQPECMVQCLSDAFIEKMEKPKLELEVTIYNIRRSGDYVPEILKKCRSLNEYSFLVEQVELYRGKGYALGNAIKEAIKVCQSKDIMKDYLQEKGSEVCNMLTAEWDWEVAERVWREEERENVYEEVVEQTALQSIRNLMETMKLTVDQAMIALKIPEENRNRYRTLV